MLNASELEALAEAIRDHRYVTVRYNRGVSTLAPYGTLTRRDELYLTAVTIARDGVQPARLKLGTFKAAGLSDLQATPVPFSPAALYAQVERQARGTRGR
ncbi:MAG: WYL domain-containing protein [Alphaproteobacteria bacterium]|nr:WYL domain-containing protein [Alphaproteobacteria bacterium]